MGDGIRYVIEMLVVFVFKLMDLTGNYGFCVHHFQLRRTLCTQRCSKSLLSTRCTWLLAPMMQLICSHWQLLLMQQMTLLRRRMLRSHRYLCHLRPQPRLHLSRMWLLLYHHRRLITCNLNSTYSPICNPLKKCTKNISETFGGESKPRLNQSHSLGVARQAHRRHSHDSGSSLPNEHWTNTD